MYNGFFVHFAGHFGFRFIRMATAGFSFIRSKRGKNKLVSGGYIYKVERVRGEKSYWVCHLPDCKGRCIQTAVIPRNIYIEKIFLFILFLGKSLSVSVGECR